MTATAVNPGPALLTLARIAAAAGQVVMRHYGACDARAI